jgi:hypothetical protein
MPIQKITRSQLPGALKAHAIIIAINRYENIGAHLRTPIADAKALSEALVTHQGFAEENIHTCYDATKAAFETFFSQLQAAGTIDAKDALLFYYAGHGLAGDIDGEGAAGYLMPSDVSSSLVKLSENKTLIPMEWLFEQLESFDCHHTLAIMDCCFAGAFRRISRTRGSIGLGLQAMTEERFQRYQEKRAWQVLASAGPAEKAVDLISERGETSFNSPFAQALVEVLSGQARPDFKPPGRNLGDGILTSHELFIYLHDEVERRTRDAAAFKPQNPDLFPMGKHDGGQFIFCDPRHPKNQPDWDQRKRKNPFKGLEQYDLADADYYFGRTSDVENLRYIMQLTTPLEVTDQDRKSPALLLVSGPSGSGKSSLIKAGLLPAYQAAEYQLFQFRPGDRPWSLQQFKDDQWQEVLSKESDPFRFVPSEASMGIPQFGSSSQSIYLQAWQKQVLYIDQFEELFTTCSSEEQKILNTYLKELLNAAMAGELRVIISMRSDFEWQLELSEFGQQFWGQENAYYKFFKLYRLTTLGLDDLRAALVHPAALFAYEFDQDEEGDLADTILEDLNYLPSALPLLSYTMQEMVTKTKRSERLFKRTTYLDKIGGVSGALSMRMQQIYDDLAATAVSEAAHSEQKNASSSPKQELLRTIFLRLVSLSDGDYIRRRVYRDQQFDELRFAEDNKDVKEVLDALRATNLISTGGEAGIRYEELIHDSLINTWTTGKKWINDFGKENLSLQRELWRAVLQSKPVVVNRDAKLEYGMELSSDDHSLVNDDNSLSRYWDTNPKLLQIITQVAESSRFLLALDREKFIDSVLGDVPEEEKEELERFFADCHAQQKFPDLNSLILSGHSGKLLNVLLHQGKHHLNLEEIEFVKTSWGKRIEDITALKRERDEARAAYERTTTEMIEVSWKTGVYLEANPQSTHTGTDSNTLTAFPGVRTMYDQLKMIMSLEKVISLSPIPVFVKGPHTVDFDLHSETFGHYNPAFLSWAKTRVIPAKHKPILRKLTQPFFNAYMKDMARAYYMAHAHLKEHPILLERRLAVYANGGTYENGESNAQYDLPAYKSPTWQDLDNALGSGYSNYYFYTGIDFWVRRQIDTTASLFFEILQELLTTYDDEWLTKEADVNALYPGKRA